ncbi:hypothetical protein GDO86_004117, partial [Hymenochirus boettgeri]
PFYENVYYPFDSNHACSSPSLLTSTWLPHSTEVNRMPCVSSMFKFKSRHENVDWRRIGAIDVDRVANELDFVTLQESIMNITFCNIEDEKCPHCKNNMDPILVKLFRLAQLTIEYLLHSQEYLTSSLRNMEEKIQVGLKEAEQMQLKMKKQSEEIRSLKEECKRRKKMIATQQIMITAGAGSYHKCGLCDKAFVNYSFLQSHIHRRHPESADNEKMKLQASEVFKKEISKLKEELHHAKCQLEAEKKTQIDKLSKSIRFLFQFHETENQKTFEEKVIKRFNSWKEEEKEKQAEELATVKEMFRKELTELQIKNASLEKLYETEHQKACDQEILKKFNQWKEQEEEKHAEELSRVHDSFRKEMKALTVKIASLERFHETENQKTFEEKVIKRFNSWKEEEKEKQAEELATVKEMFRKELTELQIKNASLKKDMEVEDLTSTSTHPFLKKYPSLTKELRVDLEQGLTERLESLGVKPGVRGIPSDQFRKILSSIESTRGKTEKQIPEIQQIRKTILRNLNCKAEKRSSSTVFELSSIPQPSSEAKLSSLRRKTSVQTNSKAPVLKPSQRDLQPEQNLIPLKPSKAKVKLVSSKAVPAIKHPVIKTPPFSSDDESCADDSLLQRYSTIDSSHLKPNHQRENSIGSEESDSEASLMEETKPQWVNKNNTEKATATKVKKQIGQMEKQGSSHYVKNQSVGTVNVRHDVAQNDNVMELEVADFDDSDFDSSSLEEEGFEVPRLVNSRPQFSKFKTGHSVSSIKNAVGAAKLAKGAVTGCIQSPSIVS